MDILEKIIAQKRFEVTRQKEVVSIHMLEEIIKDSGSCHSFKQALTGSETGIIAEFKRKSPSKNWIFQDAKVEEIIPAYESAGASAISVLTDDFFFGGKLNDLKTARNLTKLPLLRKDFIIDEYQLYQARAVGADVILLIASALTQKQTKCLAEEAHNIGLEVLLEIHSEQELDFINPFVDVVGINNRNLSTFITDIQVSVELAAKVPSEFVKISESGISSPETIKNLKKKGFQGFLMGENFMKTTDPGKALELFLSGIS